MTREELRDCVDEQRALNNIPYHVYSALIDGIDTPEQEPKRGKWIDDDPHHHKYHRCSCCGTGEFNWGADNYCRNCGARMESKGK